MTKLRIKGFAIAVILLILSISFYFKIQASENKVENNNFKVVGYYSGDLFNEPVEKIQTDKLTHIMYSFVIPKVDGTLHELKNSKQLKELVAQAHKDGAKVFISLGGWSYEGNVLEPVFKELASSSAKRKVFIENVCAMVLMIPFIKFLEEAVNAEVSYDSENRITIAKRDSITIKATIGKKFIEVNNQNVMTDISWVIKDNITYVPLRDVLTPFGYDIEWHENSKTAILITK